MSLKNPFGLKDGKLVDVLSVPNGKKCNCVCPKCGENLIAVQKRTTPYFRHESTKVCAGSLETSLHLAAKEIFIRHKKIKLPALKHNFDDFGNQTIFKEFLLEADEVYTENKLGNIVPDIILVKNNTKLLVEIAVTHFIDEEKKKKIEKIGISTIEIDLSELLKTKLDLKKLESVLIKETKLKSWVYNTKLKDLHQKKLDELIKKKKKEDEERKRKEIIREEEKRKREIFYQQYKRKVTKRDAPAMSIFSGNDYVFHIDGCPLKKNSYRGKYYANVDVDCQNCKHFRGFRKDPHTIICLFEYHNKK